MCGFRRVRVWLYPAVDASQAELIEHYGGTMLRLRLTQTTTAPNQHRVQLDLDDGVLQSAVSTFELELSEQDREDLRWYLEEYLEYPIDPAPVIAARVERRMAELGRELFAKLFPPDSDARDLWVTVRDRLASARVEVVGEVGAVLPWELLRDPRTDVPVALRADAFVRAEHQTAQRPRLPRVRQGETIRVLLVICRPAGRWDVPFRSVASHLVRLSAQARAVFQLDVLRPPTFRQLDAVLRQAAQRGKPYQVVHFDGHGEWADLTQTPTGAGAGGGRSPLRYSILSPVRPGEHGYLIFEDPDSQDNEQFVDGAALGRLLVDSHVPVLVLNACRSAHADLATRPDDVNIQPSDVHTRVRAYGSLAQEVVDAGVAGVVAMRYNVWVVTAAQFIGDLYASLLEGEPLGEAVTAGRKQLAAQPRREITFTPRPLQDWVVPVVYEAAPVKLFSKPKRNRQLTITLDQTHAGEERGRLDPSLPTTPDVGFYGRDETLLALDRAFDSQQVVLLHAYAGAGKTSTAAEFARWYQHTGGIQGPVLFISFEQHTPLSRVLDQLGERFEATLEASGIQWLTLDDAQRRQVALDILRQVPVLWIWDNVEPIAGFPTGTPSAWTDKEQRELVGFLRAVRDTKAKVLLTSRRNERGWLGELPRRVELPPMPMAERVQLARAVADKHGHRLAEVEDWRPLLAYTQGNPLAVTVLVGQALRDGIRTRERVEEFVARLRAGEASLADDEREGRSRSLGASLGYGFTHAFGEADHAQLALLHLFQGFIDVDVLHWMGDPTVAGEAAVATVGGLTRMAGIALLDRAAEVGLLTAYGDGYYLIHPALPWYFNDLFAKTYGPSEHPATTAVTRAYTAAIANLGNAYHSQYEEGHREVIGVLRAEEANLLHARRLARSHGWWGLVLGPMQGLRALYEHTGRNVEWMRLVDELIPDLADPATDGPLPGREEQWRLFTEYRERLARDQRNWAVALRLQQMVVALDRGRARAALATPPDDLSAEQRDRIRDLGGSVHELGELLREQQQPACVEAYTEALELARRIGDRPHEAIAALNLGHAYLSVPGLRDPDKAERWSKTSLDLHDDADRLGRARCKIMLGNVDWQRLVEARAARQPKAELLAHLTAAAKAYRQALKLIPADAVSELAVTHHQLGNIYADAGDLDTAKRHWLQSIRYEEAAGNRYGAAQTRLNVAAALAKRRQFGDALMWAEAALRDFEAYGGLASANLAGTRQLIARINQAQASQAGGKAGR
jgi:tetratricopeptide (TPR) repeat protein